MLTDAELLGECRTPVARPPAAGRAPYDLVLLDRDGTLNVQRPGYVGDPADLVLLPGAVEAVRACNRAGCAVVLVTNQRGLANGELTRAQLLAVHGRLVDELATANAHLDGIQVCPHEHATCDCRKPRAGLIREALRRAPWARRRRTVLLGDQPTDLRAAAAAGVRSELVTPADVPVDEVVTRLLRDHATRV